MNVKESRVQADADIGGHLVLNFVNTCGGAGKDRDVERLTDWGDAIDWATANGVVDSTDRRLFGKVRSRKGRRPPDLLKDLTELREAAHSVFAAIAGGVLPSEEARLRLERDIVEAMHHSTLWIEGRAPVRWTVCPEKAGTAHKGPACYFSERTAFATDACECPRVRRVFVAVPRSLAKQVQTVVLDGHVWKSRKSKAPLPYDESNIVNGGQPSMCL